MKTKIKQIANNALTTLHSVTDIKDYFAKRDWPLYFISPTNFNMMDMHHWVKGWKNINLLDCFDGQHPDTLVIPDDHTEVLTSAEDINRYLALAPAARALFKAGANPGTNPGTNPSQVLFLFFNAYLEDLCKNDLGLELILPPHALVREVDSKITTTEIGNQVGVFSVPNAVALVGSYAALKAIAARAGLGERWVIQSAYGDSGKTTYFVASEADYDLVSSSIEREDSVKIMRWVCCTGTAIEACATRWGTLVGPLLTELIGAPELTPYAGGWCGNELYESAFTFHQRQQVFAKTITMGDALYRRGYRGYFELDYLIDTDTQEIYLGELNARISGVTAITNMSVFSQKHLPLFLFHLLEYDPSVHLALDIEAFNQLQLEQGALGTASQLILKYTEAPLCVITQAPVSGVYRMEQGRLVLEKASTDRLEALAETQVYVLRIMQQGDYADKGRDLAILFLNQAIRASDGQLNLTGLAWVAALKSSFAFRNLTAEERSAIELVHNPVNVKSGPTQ